MIPSTIIKTSKSCPEAFARATSLSAKPCWFLIIAVRLLTSLPARGAAFVPNQRLAIFHSFPPRISNIFGGKSLNSACAAENFLNDLFCAEERRCEFLVKSAKRLTFFAQNLSNVLLNF